MEHQGSTLLSKWFSFLIVFFMILSIFLSSITVIAPQGSQKKQPYDNQTPEPRELPLLEENYIVELIHPEDPNMIDPWYIEMREKVEAYNKEMGWGNAGPPWYYDPETALYSGSRGRSGPVPLNFVSGLQEVVVIACNFSDSATEPTPNHNPDTKNTTWFNETVLFNEDPNESTMHNFYNESSYGKVNVTGEIAQNSSNTNGWYTSQYTRAQARANTKNFVIDAVGLADPDIDYSQFDNDNNGRIDHLLVIHAGNDRASSGNGSDIWSHRSWWGLPTPAGDGKTFTSYAILAENDPMGIFAHEFGHDIGLPDLYNASNGATVVGKWEVMDVGSWNTNSSGTSRPAHFGAWCKEFLGWVQPIIINETNNNQGVHQVNQTTSPTNDSVCYRVNIEGDNEYFLIENRNKTVGTFDEALPNRGILIWHIDDDMNINYPIPPAQMYYAIVLEHYQNNANASNYITGANSACWKSSGAPDQADFNVTTSPNSSSNNRVPSSIYLDRIQDNALWNMTIRMLVKDDTDPPQAPFNVSAYDAEFDNGETVNITWNASPDDGNNDNDVLFYNIYINDSSGFGAPVVLIKTVDATKASNYKTQITGLMDGVLYNFTVRADDGPNISPWPGNYTATPYDNIARAITSELAADTYPDDGGNITLSWSLSKDDPVGNATGPADILWYNISMGQIEGGSKNHLATVPPGNSNYQVENLTNNIPYYFIITAVDDVNNTGNSTEINATPTDDLVGSPSNLQVTPSSWYNITNFLLQWTNPIDNSGIVGAFYKLDGAPINDDDYTNYVPGWDIEALLVTDALSDGSHQVYVWLNDSEGNHDYTTAKSATILYDGTAPSSPIGLSANPTGWANSNSFTLSWSNPFDTSGVGGVLFSINTPPRDYNDGAYVSGDDIEILTGISVPKEGENIIYVWLVDKANNADHITNVSVKVYLDLSPPREPIDIQATPSSWTNVNNFEITWTNPTDLSGIIGARYKVDAFPTSDNDGTYVHGINITNIQNIAVNFTGSHIVYVWLVDNASNSYYWYYNTTLLYFDSHPPRAPINFEVSPSFWTASNNFTVNWTNQWDHSGIAGVYYKFNSPPLNNSDGTYVAGVDINQLLDVRVPDNGTQYIYLWLRDVAGNTYFVNYSYTLLLYDNLPPGMPIDIKSHPSDWTKENNFTVSWTNPYEDSGIAGAYYKLNAPPNSNTDGILVERPYINHISDITVTSSGAHSVYVWLVDKVDNVDYRNYATIDLLFDNTPPDPPIDLTVTPSSWTGTNLFNINWTNPPDHSGIYGLYYWFSPPTENIGSLILEDNISSINNFKIPGEAPPSDEYTIYIWLIDNALNMDYTKNSSQVLRYDVRAPSISHTRVYYATLGLPITFTAMVTDDDSGVKDVKLYFKRESNSGYIERTMVETGNIYKGEIPSDFVQTRENISYYLSATDNSNPANTRYYGYYGQTFSEPGPATDIDITITDIDMIPPNIMHQKITNGVVDTKIALTATVTDDGSGVKEVKVFYKGGTHTTFTEGRMTHGTPYFFEIPAEAATPAGIEYYLYAVDNSPRANVIYFGNYGQTTARPSSSDSYIKITISTIDDLPPEIIYGPEVTQISSTSATVYWITDEPADSVIDYGLSEIFDIRVFNESYYTIHSITLTQLTPATKYYYRVSSTDVNDNGPTQSNIHSFNTTKVGEEDNDGDGIPDSSDLDDDNDGIPDTWEELHNLDPKNPNDSNLDSDNDGYSNLLEYLSDSDPNDETSNPATLIDTTPPRIIHEPKATTKPFETLTISVDVYDNGSGVRNVTIYYKQKSDSQYTLNKMNKKQGEDNIYIFDIPHDEVTLDDLEYYIEAVDWATVSNVMFYGKAGMTKIRPTSNNDIDVDVREKSKGEDQADDDGDFFEDVGEPFGLTHAGICLMVIVLLVILAICFILALRSAFEARALANRSTKYSSKTEAGERVTWEGEEYEELDEVEDLNTIGEEDKSRLEGL